MTAPTKLLEQLEKDVIHLLLSAAFSELTCRQVVDKFAAIRAVIDSRECDNILCVALKLPDGDGVRMEAEYILKRLATLRKMMPDALAPTSGEAVAWDHVRQRIELAIEHGDAHGWATARNELAGVLGSSCFATPQSAPVDGEFVLVPREPTEAMLDSYKHDPTVPCDRQARIRSMWWHMLAAAPTPPPASQERVAEVAPWPDFAGNPIHAGDRIKHPDGVSGTVVYLPMLGPGGDAWRVVYDGEATLSRLNLQIGDKGQAVVASPPSSEQSITDDRQPWVAKIPSIPESISPHKEG